MPALSETPPPAYPQTHLDLYPRDAAFIVLAGTEGNRFGVIGTGRADTS
ncbi:hypothetical protein [Streptomyces sp. 7-21]|nr:hypothetical protein [Streptomyces sp. 7-21]